MGTNDLAGKQQAEGVIPAELEFHLAAIPFSYRGFGADAYIQNCFVDTAEDGEKWVVARPAIVNYSTIGGGGAATGQAIFQHNGFIMAVADNLLYRVASPTSTGYSSAGTWIKTTATWQPRTAASGCDFNGSVYVMGGLGSAVVGPLGALSDVWSTADFVTWTQLTPAAPWGTKAWASNGALVFNSRLFLVGGLISNNNGGSFTNIGDVWATNDGVSWEQLTTNAGWPLTGDQGSVIAFRGAMWLFGGGGSPTLTAQYLWSSVDGTSWAPVNSALPWAVAKRGYQVVAYHNVMYAMGGTVNGHEVWSSSDGLVWTLITNTAFTPANLQNIRVLVYNDAMWVMGGIDGGGTSYNALYFSTDGITWTPIAPAVLEPRYSGIFLTHETPTSSSIYNSVAMWYMAGSNSGPGGVIGQYSAATFQSSINSTLQVAYAVPSSTPYLPMQYCPCNDNRYACLKDTRGMYIWWQNVVTRVMDPNYPNITVPGVVNLDEVVYVMTPDALIVGSALKDPYTWPSRNFIGADYLSDGGVAIARYSNYLLALGTSSTQLLYNSGAPGATTLRAVKNANSNVGCVAPYTVVELAGSVFFLGSDESASPTVFMMDGLHPVPIGTPATDRIFAAANVNSKAVSFNYNGHIFYIITPTGGSFVSSLAYDLVEKRWFIWNYDTSAWPAHNYATDGLIHYFLNDTKLEVDTISASIFQDVNAKPIFVRLQFPLWTNGTDKWKTCNRFSIMMDKIATTVNLSYTDDDYNSFSTPRALSANKTRVGDTRFGRYRRRAWIITHTDNTFFRAKSVIYEVKVGNM